jgi:hypothetical protein
VSVSTAHEAWFPWIAVDDATGLVNVAYFSVDNVTNTVTNTYLAYSADNGSTWQNVKVSSQPHNTAPIPGSLGGYAGDYIGLASFGGRSYPAWMDSRSGTYQAFVAEVDFSGLPITMSSLGDLALNSPSTIIDDREYDASTYITVANISNVTDGSTGHLTLKAGNAITINPGFSTTSGDFFLAEIASESCQTPGVVSYKTNNPLAGFDFEQAPKFRNNITCFPNPTSSGEITFEYNNSKYKGDNVTLTITDIEGVDLKSLTIPKSGDGYFAITLDLRDLAEGSYLYCFKNEMEKVSDKFIIIK